MAKSPKTSAGLLLFRRSKGFLEVFLAHPGGPRWANEDDGVWTIPKGLIERGEDMLAAACREFEEETGITPHGPFIPLGSITQKAGKVVHAWAWEGDADTARVSSNVIRLEWPRKSGRWHTVPEVDRCEWFDVETGLRKIKDAQAELIHRVTGAITP